MPKVKPILPFYNENSASPAFPSLLTDQLELFGNPHHSSSLLSDEILPKSKNIMHFPVDDPPLTEQGHAIQLLYPTVTMQPHQQSQARARSHGHADSECPSEVSSLSSLLASASDTSESTSSTLSEPLKIPKPPDEPGCPGRGGYNLESAVGWNHKVFSKFKTFTHKLINQHLDTAKCASAQNLVQLKIVHDKATEAFPDLKTFSNCWPVVDLIMMRLKYTSSRARKQEMEFVAGKAKRATASK